MDLAQLQQILTHQKQAPVHLWDPENCGEMDLVIKRDGHWLYQGSIISRKPLVKLFSTVIKKEGNDYFLVTPAEKLKISVEDAPFRIVRMEAIKMDNSEDKLWVFTTNVDEKIPLNKDHPLVIKQDNKGNPVPYVIVRANLKGLLTTAVFYQLVEVASETIISGKKHLILKSGAECFDLGTIE